MHPGSVLRSIVVVLLGIVLSGSSLGAAQGTSPALPGISVVGRGEAHAPADTATLQIAVGELNYGGPTVPQAGVVPGERERDVVAPIVTALVDAGVPEEQIDVIVGPSVAEMGTYFGPAMALIKVVVDDPEREQLSDLVDTVTAAAADERLVVGRTNALYSIEDCSPLEREAREAAVEDAYQQAEVMTELVGVSLGDITGVRDVPSEPQAGFSPYGSVAPVSTCGSENLAAATYGALALPPFDPTMEPEVGAYAAVEVTFDMAGSAGATPIP